MFCNFANKLTEKVNNDDVLKSEIKGIDSNVKSINLLLFDRNIEISLSMIYGKYDPIGKLTFEHILSKENREFLWAIYFNMNGDLSEDPTMTNTRYDLLSHSGMDFILNELIDRYISQQSPPIVRSEV